MALNAYKVFVIFCITLSTLKGYGQDIFGSAPTYQSGEELCHIVYGEVSPKGEWVLVGQFKNQDVMLYTHFVGPYDSGRPTILYFTGGPGGHSHDLKDQAQLANRLGFNFLTFDQRGVLCSRPKDSQIYIDPDFVSSDLVALDASEIINHYNLKQVVIWAASYGTVPATIFASRFPDKVSSLVLEGVFYQFLVSDHVLEQLDKFWSKLNREIQDKMEAFHELPGNAQVYNPVFQILRELSLYYGEYAERNLVDYLNENSSEIEINYLALETWMKQWVTTAHGSVRDSVFKHKDVPRVDTQVYRMIIEKELGRCTRDFNAVFFKVAKGEIQEIKQTANEETYVACSEAAARNYINVFELAEMSRDSWGQDNYVILYERDIQIMFFEQKFYSLGDVPALYNPKNYVFKTPTYYLNGTFDLATPIDFAKKHFESVRMETTQNYFLSFDKLGHHPTTEVYDLGSKEDKFCMDQMLSSVFKGERLYADLEDCFHRSDTLKVQVR